MNSITRINLVAGVALLAAFALLTVLVQLVDVRPVGKNGTNVGFVTFNIWFHGLTGVHMRIYTITDWLGLVPIAISMGFTAMGAVQLVRRRSLLKVDPDILLLGVYYIAVIFFYLLFEAVPINYRPVPIDGAMEASYPSSTTLLVLSVMPTLKFQTDRRCEKQVIRYTATLFSVLFSLFMVIGRLTAGVHWATDIIGSVFLSAGLFLLYCAAAAYTGQRKNEARLRGTGNGIS